MTTYLGFEVLDLVTPDRGTGTEFDFLRPAPELSNPPGRSLSRAEWEGARQGYTFRWYCRSRAEKVALRGWVDTHFGARVPFWVPSYRRDMVLAEPVSMGASAFRIRPIRYALQVFGQGRQRRHVTFYPPASVPGTFMEISSAAPGEVFEDLGTTTAFAAAWSTSTIISFLMFVRLATDEITLRHKGPEFAIAEVPVLELHQEVP